MMSPRAALWILAVLLGAGCRRDDLPFDEGPVAPPGGTFEQQLTFSWTGLPTSFRRYTALRAAYLPSANAITVETRDDSLLHGRFELVVRGGGTGTYRYRVNGSAQDTDQVFMRFVPLYYGGLPAPELLLTGRPGDSLEAEVTIRTFGEPGDTIAGSFTGTLALPAGGGTRILIYDGAFVARRAE